MTIQWRAAPRFLACVAAGAAIAVPSASDAQQQISLDEAVSRALVRSPAMAQQQQTVDNAYLTQRTAWASFLPSLSVSGGGSLRSANVLNDATGRIEPGSCPRAPAMAPLAR